MADTELKARALSASLTVNDIQKSMDWYHGVVGFSIDQKHERDGKVVAASLGAGDAHIVIGQDDGAKGWDRVKGQGISLYLTTDQNVDDLAKLITERGGTLDSQPTDMPWGPRAFRLHDPDGFNLVISSG
jgi:uncharacterized glyoxalase superfamily protein PhnB